MAYASVASLVRTVEPLLMTTNLPMQSLICDHKEEFITLSEKVSSLEVFLKNFEKINDSGEMTDLEAQIKEVANVVEYTIQLRITEAVRANDAMQIKKAHERLRDSLKQVGEDIDRVLKESTKVQDKGKQAPNKSLVQDSSLANKTLNVKSCMVGRDDERNNMVAELLGGSYRELKVIPIVGMGGIGKTTLATDVFNDVRIRSHFDVLAWATVSKQHNVKDILLSLLHSIKEKDGAVYVEDEAELADMLQKSLKSRRYLIVLDDMWSIKAWDDLRQCFPTQNNGSRILLTTRITEVACYSGTGHPSLQMGLMGPSESWNLFKSVAFANTSLPPEFESIGKQIVDKCHGLPLTIVVVAGLLSKSKRTIEYWENVAEDVMSFVTNDPDEQCFHVLGLSYNHLTSDLKACLLYFAIFPEDREISVRRLTRLWIAEGFLKLEKDWEREAEKSLQDLVDRCLVLVCKKSWDGTKIRSCKVHDLVYELCIKEAQSQNTFVMNDIVYYDEPLASCRPSRHKMWPIKGWTEDISCTDSYRALLIPGQHHLVGGETDNNSNSLLNRTRAIYSLYHYTSNFTLKSEIIHFDLLRILDLGPKEIDSFPSQILCLIWLRYLELSGHFDIPPEICRLCNLQTFIVKGSASPKFPEQFWELIHLRHLRLKQFRLPSPPSVSVDKERCLEFSRVDTIFGLSPSSCTKKVISGIRNVKKLVIYGVEKDYGRFKKSRLFNNLANLHQLESLSFILDCLCLSDVISPVTIPSATAFPATLKKLKLYGTCLRWEDLDIIGMLPNLEVLKLIWNACEGEKWCPIVEGFIGLKLLLIDMNSLKYWCATEENFPVLERLVIWSCSDLEEIPVEFANIDSLQLIEISECTPELEASAKRIREEQEEIGNTLVDVHIKK